MSNIKKSNKKPASIKTLLNRMEIDGFLFKCPICNIKQFWKGYTVSGHLRYTHKMTKSEAKVIKRNFKNKQVKLLRNTPNKVIGSNNTNNDMDLQIIEDFVETIDLTMDDEIFTEKKPLNSIITKSNLDQKDGNGQILNCEEISENVINHCNTIDKSSDQNIIENPISSNTENIVEFDIENRENENENILNNVFPCKPPINILCSNSENQIQQLNDKTLNEANVQKSKENTSIIKIGCEKFHTVDVIQNSINTLKLSLKNNEDVAAKEKTTVTTSKESNSNITLENDKYQNIDNTLGKTGSENERENNVNRSVTSAQISYKDEEINVANLKITTVKRNSTDNMVETVKVTKKEWYGCRLCPGKLYKRELLALKHFKNKHNNIVPKDLLVTTNNKSLKKERKLKKKLKKNKIHVKDLLKDIQINKTVIETKTFNQKPFYLFGCCLCPHFTFFSMKDIFAHNRTYHEASRDLIAEMPVMPITKLIQNDSKQSELILGCFCDHIIFNERLSAKEIVNKTYTAILTERSEDSDLENKLKVIYKHGIGNGYHMSYRVIIDPMAESQEEKMKESQIEKVKVVDNVSLDTTTLQNAEEVLNTYNKKPSVMNSDELRSSNDNEKSQEEKTKENQIGEATVVQTVNLHALPLKNAEEVPNTNNTKTTVINSVNELNSSNDRKNSGKRKNEENSLDCAKDIKKRRLDEVFSPPTSKSTPTPAKLIEDIPRTKATSSTSSSSLKLNDAKKKKKRKKRRMYEYRPPILVGKWGRNQSPSFPKINCCFWPFRRNQSPTNYYY